MEFLKHIEKTNPVVVLTGAGISAESGLATFRAADGLWEGHRVEDVATPEAFIRDPDLVHDFYNQRRNGLLDPKIQPNAAHKALAELERNWHGSVLVVTQNIDDLHERGGTTNLLHMHGEVLKAFCAYCSSGTGKKVETRTDLSVETPCNACTKTGGMRPDIVWFGEMPYYMEEIAQALRSCGLFISIGTSGNVYPAAGFVQEARAFGAYTLEINLEPSKTVTLFHESITGKAGDIVPEVVEQMLS